MSNHWQELLPVDRYSVSSAGLLHDYDRKVLTLLYQPLIGPVCISLYMTLWSELEENRLWSESSLHYNLMNTMSMNLREIYDARTKLEGIGLLTVYKKKADENKQFIYEVNPPLSPEQFFTDGMLNIYLYKKVGKAQFMRLKKFFCDDRVPVGEYEQVTKSFTEIFASDHLDSLYVTDESLKDLSVDQSKRIMNRKEGEELQGFEHTFDFDLLFAGIKTSLVPRRAFNLKVRDTIAKLSFLYGIDPIQMQKLVLSSLDIDNEIDLEELRKSARDWYQLEYHADMPSLIERVQPLKYISHSEEPKTKEQLYIRHLETVSPRSRLIQLSGGAEPSKSDLQILEDIMLKQNLTPGVTNVLVEYVMIKTDMKLTKAYVEKIASHWARKRVVTVAEAMELAKSEHRQYQEWADNKKTGNTRSKKAIRTESVPEWLNEVEDVESSPAAAEKVTENESLEERKRQFEEKLRKLKTGGEAAHGTD
ncbi:replication initiation and membrane attachment family protein [Actinomycetes bacterium NPDC127524]